MADILTPLTIDFLAWLARAPRTYADVMDAWRTSCPRLTIWEDAIDDGLIAHKHTPGQPALIGTDGPRRGIACHAARGGHERGHGVKIAILDGYHDTVRTPRLTRAVRRLRVRGAVH